MATAQFVNVGTTADLPISSFIPVGDGTYNRVEIQTLDNAGYTVDSYVWTDEGGENWDEIGWVDGDNNIVTDVSFASGQGLWVFGSATTQGLQTFGKVGTSDIVVTLRAGATGTGNPFPTSVNISDILPEGDDTYNHVEIQTLDNAGYTVDSYVWTDEGGENWDETGWVDGDNNIVTDVSFAPGQGLWVYGSSSSQTIRFPAPEL